MRTATREKSRRMFPRYKGQRTVRAAFYNVFSAMKIFSFDCEAIKESEIQEPQVLGGGWGKAPSPFLEKSLCLNIAIPIPRPANTKEATFHQRVYGRTLAFETDAGVFSNSISTPAAKFSAKACRNCISACSIWAAAGAR